MKKYILLSIVFIATIVTVIAEQDFAASLKNCSSYSESGSVQAEGMNVTSRKQITGWEGDRCVYKEAINFSGINAVVTCKLTKPQITEITSVMNAYSLVQKYSNEKIDTSSLSNVQDNPVVKVWNKYLQDPSTCTMSGLDGLNK